MKVLTVKKAFKKMRRRGIIAPSTVVTDLTTKSVSSIYHDNLDELEKQVLSNLDEFNIAHNKGVMVRDSIEGLIAHLKHLGSKSTFAQKIIKNIDILLNAETDKHKYELLKKRMRVQFGKASGHFFNDLFEDADDNLVKRLFKYSLDKNKVFENKIEDIKTLYIDTAIARISGEQNDLKKRFLQRLTDWTTGESDKLDVKDVIKDMKKTSVREARFFARDQFCKFNKALLIASFKAAGVTRVKLVTVKDRAVRKSHREWEGKIFDIDNIPEEWYTDYNCRCGATPLWD